MIRCFIDFVICEVRTYESYQVAAENVQNQLSSKMQIVFMCLTVLCVVNMKIICDMKDITDKLAKASMMFMGARILLLISDNQAKFVEAFTVNSTMYNQYMDVRGKLAFSNDLPDWNFYQHQSHMFHLAMLNVECLICVIFNVIAWRSLDVEKSELMSPKPLSEQLDLERESEAQKALLQSGSE